MKVLYTSGHSLGHTSYIFQEEAVIFSGDAIPDVKDFPIFVDEKMSEVSLEKMEKLEDIQYCCPAWDRVYKEDEWKNIIKESKNYLQKLKKSVNQIEKEYSLEPDENKLNRLKKQMGWEKMDVNPLFKRSIEACK